MTPTRLVINPGWLAKPGCGPGFRGEARGVAGRGHGGPFGRNLFIERPDPIGTDGQLGLRAYAWGHRRAGRCGLGIDGPGRGGP